VIVVTGSDGQLGLAMRRILGDAAVYLTRRDCDLRDVDAVRRTVAELNPRTLINCAAYTAVDSAETNEALAFAVNADAVGALAQATADCDARFVTVSTDYVFDGTSPDPYVESSQTSPINVYGASKLAGERAALNANSETLVVRTSWVQSGTHVNFVATMIRLARERELSVVADQVGHPTLATDLAAGIVAALDAHAAGIVHMANAGVTSWYGLAREAIEIAGLDPTRITPCTTAEYPTPAKRPANSMLDSERLSGLGVTPLPPYIDGLGGLIDDLVANGIVTP
jgi:dTDP-4-dehydrorhamnose reductase